MSMTMMKNDRAIVRNRTGDKMEEKIEFRLIFAIVLPLLALGALAQIFVPRQWRAAGTDRSLKGVWASARSASKFAFMG